MSMRPVLKGSIDQSVVIRIIDSTDGTPETGVVFNTSGIDLWYRREGATKTSITEATLSALSDAHADGGFLAIGDGYYRLDLPDAAVATGANGVQVGGTVTGMVVIGCYVPLLDVNPYDAVRMGLTALPNAAAEAAGGLYTRGSGAGQINQANNGQIDANAARTGGTTNTGRDIGANVLLSAGTGTGQLDFTSGVLKANLAQILGTALTETSGQIAAGFKKFFNIATPAATMDHGVLVDTVTTLTNAPSDSSGVTTLLGKFTGITLLAQWLGLIAGKQTGNSTARTELRATGAGSGTYDETTDSQEALRDNVGTNGAALSLAKGSQITGFNDLSAAQVNTEADTALSDVGLTTTITGRIDAAVTTRATPAQVKTQADQALADVGLTTTITGRVDAAISTRLATSGYTTPPTVGAIADQVWEEALGDHSATSGSTAEALAAAGGAGDPWITPLPGSYSAGQAGYIIGNLIDDLTAALPDALLDEADAVEAGLTVRGALRLVSAALAGKLSGANTGTTTIRNAVADSKARIVATTDATGRTSVTTDAT